MPFPVNWLEELAIEWMDLEGFAISTSISVPAEKGGRLSPDVVGAKLDPSGRRLLIRHCEAAMHLIQGADKVATRYSAKFSPKIEQTVRTRFAQVFGHDAPEQVAYEKWVITFQPSAHVQDALGTSITGIKVCLLKDFVLEEVLPAIERWREPPHTKTTALPGDKWLLHLIDCFHHFGLIAVRPG